MDFQKIETNTIQDYMDLSEYNTREQYVCDFLDVHETISELSYLTHDYFRYYGKFPSKVAGYIIRSACEEGIVRPQRDFIFDNYNGSGTSLVEAKLAGFASGGIDINPFGVLASNVKTRNLDGRKLSACFSALMEQITRFRTDDGQQSVFSSGESGKANFSGVEAVSQQIRLDFPDITKWFDPDTVQELCVIKYCLLQMPRDDYRAFFLLGFFSIIRRVSKAHDAEVRPHVNPKKRKRNAFDAYEKKLLDMMDKMESWNQNTSPDIESRAVLCDNSGEARVTEIIQSMREDFQRDLGLVLSHPPYLNCFDYIPVYRLKFLWAFGFDEIYGQMSYQEIKNAEIRSYPASNAAFVNNYFRHNIEAYRILYQCLKPGGCCCVVIGDCTMNKALFPVHKILIKAMESVGYTVEKITYRSTAYGMGRYAYRHRADYNDKDGGKQDAILFFRK